MTNWKNNVRTVFQRMDWYSARSPTKFQYPGFLIKLTWEIANYCVSLQLQLQKKDLFFLVSNLNGSIIATSYSTIKNKFFFRIYLRFQINKIRYCDKKANELINNKVEISWNDYRASHCTTDNFPGVETFVA